MVDTSLAYVRPKVQYIVLLSQSPIMLPMLASSNLPASVSQESETIGICNDTQLKVSLYKKEYHY